MGDGDIYVKLYDGVSAEDRNAIFALARERPAVVKFVCDLSAITRETLDLMLLPTSEARDPAEARNRGAKIIYARSERAKREPEPLYRPKTLRERMGR